MFSRFSFVNLWKRILYKRRLTKNSNKTVSTYSILNQSPEVTNSMTLNLRHATTNVPSTLLILLIHFGSEFCKRESLYLTFSRSIVRISIGVRVSVIKWRASPCFCNFFLVLEVSKSKDNSCM